MAKTTKMGGGVKYDQGKPRMSLLPREGLIPIVQVLEFGARKYGDYNWRKGMKWSIPLYLVGPAPIETVLKEKAPTENPIHQLFASDS